jgi:hypothetical protein
MSGIKGSMAFMFIDEEMHTEESTEIEIEGPSTSYQMFIDGKVVNKKRPLQSETDVEPTDDDSKDESYHPSSVESDSETISSLSLPESSLLKYCQKGSTGIS